MALVREFFSDKAKQVRRQKDKTNKEGAGDDKHVIVGNLGSGGNEWIHRSLLRFVNNWTDVKTVIKIELALKAKTDTTHFAVGAKPKLWIMRLTEAFAEGSGGEGVWSGSQYEWPSAAGGVGGDVTMNPDTGAAQNEAWTYIDITDLYKPISSDDVAFLSGGIGGNGVNNGLMIRSPGDELDNAQRMTFYSFHDVLANQPRLRVTYDPINTKPLAPILTGPAVTNVTMADSFEGQHVDPDLDPMSAREILVYLKGGGTAIWPMPVVLQIAGSDETETGIFSVPLSLAAGSLKSQIDYEWTARTRDPLGEWGPHSARRALRITSSAPSVVAYPITTVPKLLTQLFGGDYTDPDGNALAKFVIQAQPQSAFNDAFWSDAAYYIWDTGETIPTAGEISTKKIEREYAGEPVAVGNYTYRIKVQDSSGVWSPWSYDNWTLTAPYSPDPDDIELITMVQRQAPIRIALYRMGPDRSPGALIGYLDDPMDLGASGYLNGGGEVYFTLPALHPYCPEMEPHQTHYAIEQWYGDRFRVLQEFSGVITDFDGVADELVVYGTNYLGLLQGAVDERFNPAKESDPANGSGGGGSKYVDKTIDYVIRDQLLYHKIQPNSPVGFIQIPAIGPSFSALAERVTIFSTYTECLPFILGLIDSHKQGTGREARFYCRPIASPGATTLAANAAALATNIKVASVANFAVGDIFRLGDTDVHKITVVGTAGAGGTGITFTNGLLVSHVAGEAVTEQAYEWALIDNWGKDRKNIRLEYGGLLNDFRVVALGDFGTRVLGIGQKRGEVKVFRAKGTGGLPEATFGVHAKTRFYQDIIDQNDLQRRVNEDASQLAKVGKRMALAIRADMLNPFDGWDLGDSIVVDIVRGVIDTSKYGSLGLWTIYGIEWRYYPDGHTDLTPTVLPKKTVGTAPIDLLPSINPGLAREWQTGYGKPTSYGIPPSPSH